MSCLDGGWLREKLVATIFSSGASIPACASLAWQLSIQTMWPAAATEKFFRQLLTVQKPHLAQGTALAGGIPLPPTY
jgi:hypothetical protein